MSRPLCLVDLVTASDHPGRTESLLSHLVETDYVLRPQVELHNCSRGHQCVRGSGCLILQAHEVRPGDELDTDWTLHVDWVEEQRLRTKRGDGTV